MIYNCNVETPNPMYNKLMTNKLTPEEKEFNKAMCTTCLLDWPMAQCLSCKFYAVEHEVEFDPNTMEMNMDYRTTTKVLQAVEQATLEQMVAENPGNTYWEKRLADFLANCNPADVAQRIEQEIDSRIGSDSKKWDFTPIPSDMPIIDFDNIPEIPF